MKQLVKNALLNLYMGLPDKIRDWVRKEHFIILYYHQISPEQFREHIDFIQANFSVISLLQAKQHLYGETKARLPRNALAITFDDGWRSNYELLPLIREIKVPVTIFLAAGIVGTNRKIWNYSIDRKGKDSLLNEQLKAMTNKDKDRKLLKFNKIGRAHV